MLAVLVTILAFCFTEDFLMCQKTYFTEYSRPELYLFCTFTLFFIIITLVEFM